MKIFNDFDTSVRKALTEIDSNWEEYDGLIVCGTHNQQYVDLILGEIKQARELKLPTLLICAGHQLGAIEYARNVIGIANATSEEFGKGTFVVKKRPQMKVGLHAGESWWSSYYVAIEWKIPENFISVAFHPEYQSSKFNPHPILKNFLRLCKIGNAVTQQH